MDIQDLKLWHWLTIGAIVGLLLGYIWSITPPGRDRVLRRPMTAAAFSQQLSWCKSTDEAWLRNVIVYPPEDGQQRVIGEVSRNGQWEPFSIYVRLPFRPSPSAPVTDLQSYLESLHPGGQPILASYLWWDAPWFGPCAGTVIGLIVIGGIWPIILNLLIGAGFGRRHPIEDDYDLDRFKHEPPPQSAPAQPTEEDKKQLQQLDESLEAKLRHEASPSAAASEHGPSAPAPVKELTGGPLQESAPPPDEDAKEYSGEYYPVAHPHRPDDQPKAFSMVELLVVFGIITILIGLLMPALRRAREQSAILACANNLHQISLAMQMYLNDNQGVYFWHGEDINTEGMDWYTFGGRETGNRNLGQNDLFNRTDPPRPLNQFVGNNLNVFHCPNDNEAPWTFTYNPGGGPYPAPSEFDWVGNSYSFNAVGYPIADQTTATGGLDGVKTTSISDPTRMIVFYDSCLRWGGDWHYGDKANIAFADGHVEFLPLPDADGAEYRWNP